MELTAELFDEITKALGASSNSTSSTAAATDSEQRGAGRMAISADVLMAPYTVTAPQSRRVKLRSLSRGGAAVLETLLRQPGERVVLHLPKADGQTIPIVCMVMNTRLTKDGEFRLGLQFRGRAENVGATVRRSATGVVSCPPGAAERSNVIEQVARLAETGTKPRLASGERDERVDMNMQGLVSEYEDGRIGPMYFATIKDISLGGGVCVIQPEPMKTGEQFILQVPRERGKPLTLICTVVDSRPHQDGQHRIGARYQVRLLDHPGGGRTGLLTRVRRWFAA